MSEIEHRLTATSTNDLAREALRSGAGHGHAIRADMQTSGRGRMGNRWVSLPGNLHLSIVLLPRIKPSNLPLITLATAVAVQSSLNSFKLETQLSWPNDLIVLPHHRKVGGILVESVFEGDLFMGSVVGVGINITLNPEALSMPLSQTVTSFSNENIELPDLDLLSESLRSKILGETAELESGRISQLLNAWRERNITVGNRITYVRDNLSRSGTALDLDEKGALVIDEDHTGLVKVHSGEVRLVVNSDSEPSEEQ